MAQDVKVGRETLPIPDQPYKGLVPFDTRTAEAPKQAMLRASEGAPNVWSSCCWTIWGLAFRALLAVVSK